MATKPKPEGTLIDILATAKDRTAGWRYALRLKGAARVKYLRARV